MPCIGIRLMTDRQHKYRKCNPRIAHTETWEQVRKLKISLSHFLRSKESLLEQVLRRGAGGAFLIGFIVVQGSICSRFMYSLSSGSEVLESFWSTKLLDTSPLGCMMK